MHWSQMREASFTSGIRVLFALFRVAGRWPFRLVLYPVLSWYVATSAGARAASLDYLARLHASTQGRSPKPGLFQVFKHFAAFAECLLDKLLVWSGQLQRLKWRVQDDGSAAALLTKARGALILTSHVGNLELCRVLSAPHSGVVLNILVHTKHNPQFNRLLSELNPDSELRLLQVSDLHVGTAMLLSERVQRGEFVAIAGDRVPLGAAGHAPDTVDVDFLGAKANLPIGPYVLASVLKCPILVLLVSLRADGVYLISLVQLCESVQLPRKDRVAAIRPLAQRYADLLGAECAAAPLQWFNFFPFWAQAK